MHFHGSFWHPRGGSLESSFRSSYSWPHQKSSERLHSRVLPYRSQAKATELVHEVDELASKFLVRTARSMESERSKCGFTSRSQVFTYPGLCGTDGTDPTVVPIDSALNDP